MALYYSVCISFIFQSNATFEREIYSRNELKKKRVKAYFMACMSIRVCVYVCKCASATRS